MNSLQNVAALLNRIVTVSEVGCWSGSLAELSRGALTTAGVHASGVDSRAKSRKLTQNTNYPLFDRCLVIAERFLLCHRGNRPTCLTIMIFEVIPRKGVCHKCYFLSWVVQTWVFGKSNIKLTCVVITHEAIAYIARVLLFSVVSLCRCVQCVCLFGTRQLLNRSKCHHDIFMGARCSRKLGRVRWSDALRWLFDTVHTLFCTNNASVAYRFPCTRKH